MDTNQALIKHKDNKRQKKYPDSCLVISLVQLSTAPVYPPKKSTAPGKFLKLDCLSEQKIKIAQFSPPLSALIHSRITRECVCLLSSLTKTKGSVVS